MTSLPLTNSPVTDSLANSNVKGGASEKLVIPSSSPFADPVCRFSMSVFLIIFLTPYCLWLYADDCVNCVWCHHSQHCSCCHYMVQTGVEGQWPTGHGGWNHKQKFNRYQTHMTTLLATGLSAPIVSSHFQ
jgi:hypothetical protein